MKVLFYSNDGKLGDAVLHTALVQGIKQQHPDAQIFCITAQTTTAFWQRDPRITQQWPVYKLNFRQIIRLGWQIRKHKIDYIIAWSPIRAEKIRLLAWLIRPRKGVKTFIAAPNEHASIKEQQALTMLGCDASQAKYAIWPPQKAYQFQQPSLYLNVFASCKERSLSDAEILDFIRLIKQQIPTITLYMTCVNANQARLQQLLQQIDHPVEVVNCEQDLDKLIVLCMQVTAIITPDTAITHLASAYNKPVAVLFEKDNHLLQTNWAPISDQHLIEDYFLNEEAKKQQVRAKVVNWIKQYFIK